MLQSVPLARIEPIKIEASGEPLVSVSEDRYLSKIDAAFEALERIFIPLDPRSGFTSCPKCGLAHPLCESFNWPRAPERWPLVVGLCLSAGIAAALLIRFGT
jgi:hypothetical protein